MVSLDTVLDHSVKIHVRAGHAKTPRPYTFENVDTMRAIRLPQLAIAPRIVHHNDAAGCDLFLRCTKADSARIGRPFGSVDHNHINDRLSYRLQIVGSYELFLIIEFTWLVVNIGDVDSASR